MEKKRIQKKQLNKPSIVGTIDNVTKSVAEAALKGLGLIGEGFNKFITSGASTDFGQTSPFTFSSGSQRRNIHKRREQVGNTVMEKAAPYISPSNHVASWFHGSLDPRVGQHWWQQQDPRIQLGGVALDIATLGKGPKVIKSAPKVIDKTLAKTPKLVKKATSKVRKEIRTRKVSKEINKGIDNTILSTKPKQSVYQYTIPNTISPSTSATTYRTSALGYRDWMRGTDEKPPIVTVDDPNAAFIELRSHPDGHATVKRRHLIDKKTGEDITFTFNKDEASRNNVIQLEFDDSHGQPIRTLSPEEVEYQINNGEIGNWKGTIIDEEFKKGNKRGLTFRNITPEQADQLIDFVDNNRGKDVYVHCLRGSSRSGAVDKFLQEYYGYSRPPGKLVKEASPEVYDTLVDAYKRKHGSGLNYYK